MICRLYTFYSMVIERFGNWNNKARRGWRGGDNLSIIRRRRAAYAGLRTAVGWRYCRSRNLMPPCHNLAGALSSGGKQDGTRSIDGHSSPSMQTPAHLSCFSVARVASALFSSCAAFAANLEPRMQHAARTARS